MNLIASRTAGRLRFIVPTCTIFPYARVASTIFRPSHPVGDEGFRPYTSWPACSAQIVASACQWFGVAMTMASISLSSITRRRSCTKPGLKVGTSCSFASLMRSGARFASMSHSDLISTFFSRANPRLSELPWPRIPMLAVPPRPSAPRMRLPPCGAAWSCDVKKSPPTARPAAAAPTLVANSRRVTPFDSFCLSATGTPSCRGTPRRSAEIRSARNGNRAGVGFVMLSRRRFIGMTAAAAAPPLFGRRAGADPRVHPSRHAGAAPAVGRTALKLGVASYSMREFTLDQTLEMARRLGVKYMTFKDVHVPRTEAPELTRARRAKIEAAGITIMGGGTITIPNDPAQIRKEFEYARNAGFPLIYVDPMPAALDTIETFAKEYDIRVAIHNHGPEDKRWPRPHDPDAAVKC